MVEVKAYPVTKLTSPSWVVHLKREKPAPPETPLKGFHVHLYHSRKTKKDRVVENYNTFYSERTWAMCERLRCGLYELILCTSLWLLGVLGWWPTQKMTPWSAPSQAAKVFHQHSALNWLTWTPSKLRAWMIIYRGDKRTQVHPLSFAVLSKVVNQDASAHSTQGAWSHPLPNSIWT